MAKWRVTYSVIRRTTCSVDVEAANELEAITKAEAEADTEVPATAEVEIDGADMIDANGQIIPDWHKRGAA